MKLWTKIKSWIVRPYIKPLKLKKEWEIEKTSEVIEKLLKEVLFED